MKNRNKFFEIFAAAAVLFAGCSNSINPQEKSLPGTVIIKPVLPGQGARYVSPELKSSNMIYYYYAKKEPSQTTDNNSYSDNYSGFLEPANKSFPAALKNHGYNVGNTVKVADGEYVFNVLGYTVSTSESIINVIDDIKKLGNSNDQTQSQDLPSKFTVSGSVIVDCTNKTTVQVPMFWNGDCTGLGITTTTTVTSNYPNVKVVDALDFSYQFQSDDNSYANGNNGTTSNPTYDFCLKLTECIAQPDREPIIVNLKTTDDNGNAVYDLIVEEKQNELGVITTTVKINPEYTKEITAGLWNIGFYKEGKIVSTYQYNTVMLVPGVKTTFNLDFNSYPSTSSVFVKIPVQSSENQDTGFGTLLSPFTEFKYSLDTLENFPNTEVLLSNVEHNTPESFNESNTQRIVLDLNGFTLSAGIDIETNSAYPFTACNSTIKNGRVEAHLEMTKGGSLENVTFPCGSEASGVISDANIITVSGDGADDVTNSIVYSFNNVKADYIQIKNPGVIIDSLVNGTNNIVKGIIIGDEYSELPKIAKSWRIGNPNTDFRNISLFKYVEDPEDPYKTFKIVATTDYKIEKGCIVYRPEPMGVISKDDGTMFNFCSLQGGNSIATSGAESSYQINGFKASICAKTFDHNGYPWVLASFYDNIDGILYYYILNQDRSVFCKIDSSDLGLSNVVMAADENYLYLCLDSCSLLRIPYSDLLNKDIIIQKDAIQGFDLTGGEEVIVSNFSLAAADNGDLYLLYKYDYYTLDENDNRLKVSLEKITKIYFDESGKLVVDTQSTKVLTGSDDGDLSKSFPVIEFSKKDFYYSYKNIWGEPDQNGTWSEHTGYKFRSDDKSLSFYASEKISINYSCYDMVYNNGKLYIPVDIKLDGLNELFPVVVSTGNLIVYDIYSDNFEVKGNTIDSNKLENLEIPKAVVNYDNIFNDVDMEKPAETFKIVTYLPEPDQTQALMGAGKIIAIKDDQVIFVENGVFFEMDSYGKWKTSNNQGEKIKYKHKQQAVIFTNNLFQRASVPTDYINYSNSGSTTIPVGYTLDCNINGHSSELHTLQYQFDVE